MISKAWLVLVTLLLSGGSASQLLADPGVRCALYAPPRANTVTFWGHACSYIDVNGVGILTDPVFADSYGTFHRREIPAPPPEACAGVRIVLISHAHHDHLNPETLARLRPGTVVLCPRPAAKYIQDLDLKVMIMAPGETYSFPGGVITAVAAHHPGGRLSLKARHDGRALGYVIETGTNSIYYTGDTEYFEGFHAVGRRYRPDIVILNVSCHLNYLDAYLAVAALGFPTVIPSHFGAYGGSNARHSPGWHAELAGLLGNIWTPLRVGESYSLHGESEEPVEALVSFSRPGAAGQGRPAPEVRLFPEVSRSWKPRLCDVPSAQ